MSSFKAKYGFHPTTRRKHPSLLHRFPEWEAIVAKPLKGIIQGGKGCIHKRADVHRQERVRIAEGDLVQSSTTFLNSTSSSKKLRLKMYRSIPRLSKPIQQHSICSWKPQWKFTLYSISHCLWKSLPPKKALCVHSVFTDRHPATPIHGRKSMRCYSRHKEKRVKHLLHWKAN